ncbi:unnamed protein product [Cylindrotheca closterium]|uniref:Uncharacterized protein n=1 Tax=Cylindrotheca closterium TaxID=2856 RepID=A0AAD2JGI5_9STRA|nr:unnamed protein product [Cylindrotheca closterium]
MPSMALLALISSAYCRFALILIVINVGKTESLSKNAPTAAKLPSISNSRFVCLIQDYDKVQGPYFHALLDQMMEKECRFEHRRLALCTTRKHASWCQKERVSQLEQDFGLDGCQLFVLDDYNPMTLKQEMEDFDPTIFWLVDDNAFRIRYFLRTSGLDGMLYKKCGSSNGNNCLYVGENSGALCTGCSLAGAHVLQQDPKEAPEPQFFGLGLLGSERSVSICVCEDSKGEGQDDTKNTEESDSNVSDKLIALEQDHVYVWSQPKDESATSFVFLPSQRGSIANLDSPLSLPPLVVEENNLGGVQCTGEPAIDPSRMMEQVGDSEWINEAEDARQ